MFVVGWHCSRSGICQWTKFPVDTHSH